MDAKYLVLSDIHGNLSALQSVLDDCAGEEFEGVMLVGDCIDYGMRSNDVVAELRDRMNGAWRGMVLANVWGNHERLVVARDLDRLSSDRGRDMARYTAARLSPATISYINGCMEPSGMSEIMLGGMKCLVVHGSLDDPYWRAIGCEDVRGDYSPYDLVISGHSHYPHCFAKFYPAERSELRNRKATLFVNPGSVGQPRNQNPCAQYAVITLPSRRVDLRAVRYDVEYEQSLYPQELDRFYRDRLAYGV